MDTLDIYTLHQFQKEMEIFLSYYMLEKTISCPDKKIHHKPQRERQCRFCNKSYELPNTRFKSQAHIIPEFLGNKYLTSDFECDSCNSKFSSYENHLKHYLGIIPTITQTIGKKNKIPSFPSPDEKLIAKLSNRLPIEGNFTEIFKKNAIDDAITVDFDSGRTIIKYKKHPYIPYHVYKALLKMGLSCLSEEELNQYAIPLRALQNDTLSLKPFANISVTYFPLNIAVKKPYILLFKKKNPSDNTVTHTLLLRYQNIAIQFYLPLNILDNKIYDTANTNNIICPVAPPFLFQKVSHEINVVSQHINLSNSEVQKSEIEQWGLQFDAKLEDTINININTGEIVNSFGNTMGILLIPAGTIIPKDAFKK